MYYHFAAANLPSLLDQIRQRYSITTDIHDIRRRKYSNNVHGFRDSDSTAAADIACFGCSVTYGIGVEHDLRWSNLLDHSARNYGVNGLSCGEITHVAASVLQHHPAQTAVVLFPDLSRQFLTVVNDQGQLEQFNAFANYDQTVPKSQYPQRYSACSTLYRLPTALFQQWFALNLQSLVDVTQLLNRRLILASWCLDTDLMLRSLPLAHYPHVSLVPFLAPDTQGTDRRHPGPLYHQRLSQLIGQLIPH